MMIETKTVASCIDECVSTPTPQSEEVRNRHKSRNRGFTLVEMLLVMMMIFVLVVIAIPVFQTYRDKARSSRAMSEIRTIELAIGSYFADNGGVYPDSLNRVGYGTLLDPWKNGYHYSPPGSLTYSGHDLNTDYDLWSTGADGSSGATLLDDASLDDIVRAGGGNWVGRAENYVTP